MKEFNDTLNLSCYSKPYMLSMYHYTTEKNEKDHLAHIYSNDDGDSFNVIV